MSQQKAIGDCDVDSRGGKKSMIKMSEHDKKIAMIASLIDGVVDKLKFPLNTEPLPLGSTDVDTPKQVAVATLIENGRTGTLTIGEIALDSFREYFEASVAADTGTLPIGR